MDERINWMYMEQVRRGATLKMEILMIILTGMVHRAMLEEYSIM